MENRKTGLVRWKSPRISCTVKDVENIMEHFKCARISVYDALNFRRITGRSAEIRKYAREVLGLPVTMHEYASF
jgi:phage host-nuclease inhibitor protein Gam